MRAAVIHAPHDLRIEDIETGEIGPGQALVRIEAGGICGSDLHYYHHGGFGTVRIREPMVLGHEIAGRVLRVAEDVTNVKPGDTVAVNPSFPCGHCRYCLAGQSNHCLDMRFFGSAMRFPHVNGGFRDELIAHGSQLVPVPEGTPASLVAFAEPLAVCLHGMTQAGPLLGKRVLVTGCGPIGALAIIAARRAGALEIVVTDVAAAALPIALSVGADRGIDVSKDADALAAYEKDKGYFDVVFEASGNGRALASALPVIRPGGTIVLLGLGGDVSLSVNTIVAKEIALKGTFRFHEEFAWAVELLAKGLVDVKPLLSATVPLAEAEKAFALASDRSKAMKVQLSFV